MPSARVLAIGLGGCEVWSTGKNEESFTAVSEIGFDNAAAAPRVEALAYDAI